MIKTNLLLLAALLAGISSRGQGVVNIDTSRLGTVAQVWDVGHSALLAGTSFMTRFYAAPGLYRQESELVPVGVRLFFRSTPAGLGYDQFSGIGPDGGQVYIQYVLVFQEGDPGSTPAGPVTIQMRAWESAFPTYESAVSGGGKSGKSSLVNMRNTFYDGLAIPPWLSGLEGPMRGFDLQIPEPSTLALGLLAAAAVFWHRKAFRWRC